MDTKNNTILSILLCIIVAGLIYAGVSLTSKSNDVYIDSKGYVDTALKDSILKTKVSLAPSYSTIKDGYSEALLYFTLALGVIILAVLLPRIQSLSFGGVTITLKDLQQQVNDLKAQNNDLTQKAVNIDSNTKTREPMENIEQPENKAEDLNKEKELINDYPDDPQKGKWGGNSQVNGRKLTAEVKETALLGWYQVNLKVVSTTSTPLTGLVTFHLHNTFINPDPIISVINNEANLSLKMVYGAFTVGAEADNGNTKLELDLAELPGIPQRFKDS